LPDREREHAVQRGDPAGAVLHELVKDDLGVAARPELMALTLEPGAQALEVIDLAVVRDDHVAFGVLHRLGSARDVDDRQAPVADRDLPAAHGPIPHALAVRAAVRDAREHARERLGIRRFLYESRDAAHELAAVATNTAAGHCPARRVIKAPCRNASHRFRSSFPVSTRSRRSRGLRPRSTTSSASWKPPGGPPRS